MPEAIPETMPETIPETAPDTSDDAPTGCGYEGYEFGGGYIDSVCIDGTLWDLDSCDDDGNLISGGAIPCRKCNTAKWVAYLIDDFASTIHNGAHSGAMLVEQAIAAGLDENRAVTLALLTEIEPFVALDWPDRENPDLSRLRPSLRRYDGMIERTWPWPVDLLSAHEQMEINVGRARRAARETAAASVGSEAGDRPE